MHLRLDDDLDADPDALAAENAAILGYLGAAREYAEGVTGLCLAVRTVEQTLDRFPCGEIALQALPLREVDLVEYVDGAGVPQTLDPNVFVVDEYRAPARLVLAYGQAWPEARCEANAVRVRYVVGYGATADTPPDTLALPRDIRSALLLIMAHLYENREESAPIALERIPAGALTLLGLKRENMGV